MTFLAIYKYKAYKFHRFFMWIFSGQNGNAVDDLSTKRCVPSETKEVSVNALI